MKVLVTGATGFLGSAVVRALLVAGHSVRVLVHRNTGAPVLGDPRVEVATGDVCVPADVDAACAGMEAVISNAAFVSFRPRDSAAVWRVTVEGTSNVLTTAARQEIRVLLTSSISTMGLTAQPQVVDERAHWSSGEVPDIAYVKAKVESERIASLHARRGADVVILNPGILLGAGQGHQTSTRAVVQMANAPLLFYPPGGMSLGHVDEVAGAYVSALSKGRRGERYILAGVNVSFAEFVRMLATLTGKPPPLPLPLPLARWWGALSTLAAQMISHPYEELTSAIAEYNARYNYCDASKARSELGYRTPSLESMLRETLADVSRQGLVASA